MAKKVELFIPVRQSQLLEGKTRNTAFVESKWMAENISLLNGYQWNQETNDGNPSVEIREEKRLLFTGR